jgi:adenylate cyclase
MFARYNYWVVALFSLFLHLYFYHSTITQNIDYKLYDTIKTLLDDRFSQEESSHTVIVNIDERSLQAIGQWPWSRVIDAKLIEKIQQMYPAAIGINLLFSEADRTSPLEIEQFYKAFLGIDLKWGGLPHYLKDNDHIFAERVKEAGAILPVYLYGDQESKASKNLTDHHRFSNLSTDYHKTSMIRNYKELQQGGRGFGFINLEEDSDVFLRRIPLFMHYKDQLIPTFGLAILLSLNQGFKIENETTIEVLGHKIAMAKSSEVMLNFHATQPKIVSAIDILRGEVSSLALQGKIVLVGLSAIGDEGVSHLAHNQRVSNVNIHATLIENILNDQLIVQPESYKIINTWLSLLLSLLILFWLIKGRYLSILGLFLITNFLSIIGTSLAYSRGVYISIGYLWTPFIAYFFIISLLFIVINIREKRRFYEELRASHRATIDSLALVISMRDDETGEHLHRTKNYVKVLAEYLLKKGHYPEILNKKYIQHLYEAAPLHDIGKVGIPDKILKKPGRYTPEEYEVMKQHPLLAKEVIEKAMHYYDKNVFLELAHNIAYYHHERWDGRGYPEGLKGEEIPLEAQLMAVADVYDALVSRRCYKEGYAFEKAEEIIFKERGSAFNPLLVDLFMEIKEEFREIATRWRDREVCY